MFLSWFEQYYDVFIDVSPRRFSPFHFNRFCDVAYTLNSGANALSTGDNTENVLLFVFSLPSSIDGLRRISVKMSVADVERIWRAVGGNSNATQMNGNSITQENENSNATQMNGNSITQENENSNATQMNDNNSITHENGNSNATQEDRNENTTQENRNENTAKPTVLNLIKKHIKHVLSLDTDLCVLEEIGSNALVLTRDGRVKVTLVPSFHS